MTAWKIALALAGAALSGTAAARAVKIGEAAPPFTLHLLDRTALPSDALKGDVVVLNLWATWCAPCKAEMPLLDAYYRAHAKQGLRIFAIPTQDSASDAQLRKVGASLAFPIVHDLRGPFPALDGLPTSYVIDRHGIVRYAERGAFTAATLDVALAPLLAEATGSDAH